MFFKKNKIARELKKAKSEDQVASSEFDSLNTVNERTKITRLKNNLKNQYHDGIELIKHNSKSLYKYFLNHWFSFFKYFLILLTIVVFIFGLIIMYKSFFVGIPSNNFYTPINNFYLAKFDGNSVSYALSNSGIGFICIFAVMILSLLFYVFWAWKTKHVVFQLNKGTKIISIICYVLIAISILLMIIPLLIPPSFDKTLLNGQEAWNLIAKINNTSLNEEVRFNAIKELYGIFGFSVPNNFTDALEDFKSKLINQEFYTNNIYPNYSFIQNVNYFSPSTISAVGIAILVLILVFFASGMVFLPISIYMIKMVHDYRNENINIHEEWNGFKIFILNFVMKIKNIFSKIFKRKSKKDKNSYHKYKKQLKKEGKVTSVNNENFGSEVVNNARTNVITKQEIESHEPNKAFLNNQGQWMYHDGNGNYFIVKNDNWIPYDINTSIHSAHVAQMNVNETLMSQKTKKESKWAINNKFVDNLTNKHKKDTLVDLPDEDLDKILSELDI